MTKKIMVLVLACVCSLGFISISYSEGRAEKNGSAAGGSMGTTSGSSASGAGHVMMQGTISHVDAAKNQITLKDSTTNAEITIMGNDKSNIGMFKEGDKIQILHQPKQPM